MLRYAVAEDCGRVINPLVADGQVHGGVAQGIGAALLEEVVHDRSSGQLLTASFVDYLVPSAAEIPSMEVVHLETPAENNVGGFRGIGEGGTIGAPARHRERDRGRARGRDRGAARDPGAALPGWSAASGRSPRPPPTLPRAAASDGKGRRGQRPRGPNRTTLPVAASSRSPASAGAGSAPEPPASSGTVAR